MSTMRPKCHWHLKTTLGHSAFRTLFLNIVDIHTNIVLGVNSIELSVMSLLFYLMYFKQLLLLIKPNQIVDLLAVLFAALRTIP